MHTITYTNILYQTIETNYAAAEGTFGLADIVGVVKRFPYGEMGQTCLVISHFVSDQVTYWSRFFFFIMKWQYIPYGCPATNQGGLSSPPPVEGEWSLSISPLAAGEWTLFGSA